MKNYTTYIQVFIVSLVMLVSSCVDDDAFFSKEQEGDMVSSIAMVSILNSFNNHTTFPTEEMLCFKFVYPIYLGYNTYSKIRIDNYQGLIDMISSQSANFNITGLQFPVQVVYKGTDVPSTISQETELIQVLKECQFETIRDKINDLYNSCFKFDYPITLISGDKKQKTVNSKAELDSFYQDQDVDYQPIFKFPISLFVAPDFTSKKEIGTYFEFYEILDECSNCPELSFVYEQTPNTLEFSFNARFDGVSEIVYDWKIDNQYIETDGGTNGDNILITELDPGVHNVCIKMTGPTCVTGTSFCKEITVEPICPDPFFIMEQEGNTTGYNFSADFAGMTDYTYSWKIDGDVIEEDGGSGGDNVLYYQFVSGTYEICIWVLTPTCPDGVLFCEELIIP